MPPLRYGFAIRPAVLSANPAIRSKKLAQAEHDFRKRVLREKHQVVVRNHFGKVEDSVIFRKLCRKAAARSVISNPPSLIVKQSMTEEKIQEEPITGGVIVDAMEEEANVEEPLIVNQPPTFDEQMEDGTSEHPFLLDENKLPDVLNDKGVFTQHPPLHTVLHPPFILEKVDKKTNEKGFIRHPPPPISRLVNIFGATLNAPLSKTDIKYLKLAGIDLDRAAEAWKAIQHREEHRLLTVKLLQEEQENIYVHEKNKNVMNKGSKLRARSGISLLSVNKMAAYRRHPESLDAVRLRVKFIAESVATMEKKLRRNMKAYIEAWRAISSSIFPYRKIPEFRDLPWPVTDAWATAPSELTKEEVKRFLFSNCNVPKSSSRTEVFDTAIAFWETDSFRQRLLRHYPGSKAVSDKVMEGARLVYSHLQELEEELEPEHAASRKRRREEVELRNKSSKKRRFVTDIWVKFTGVLRYPTSFDFNTMSTGFA